MPTAFPLPDPCPVCGGVIMYAGRGGRPRYDRPECRRKDRTDYERDRARRARRPAPAVEPEVAVLAERRRERVAARPRFVEAERFAGDWIPGVDDLRDEYGGEPWSDEYVVDDERGSHYLADAVPRSQDPAVQWLIESGNAAELATFPHAASVGRTGLSLS